MSLPTIAAIQRATAAHYGIPYEKMREPRSHGEYGHNRWEFSRPRQVAICLAARLTDHRHTVIGRHFGGRHNTTILYATREIERRSRSDPELYQALRTITLALVSH